MVASVPKRVMRWCQAPTKMPGPLEWLLRYQASFGSHHPTSITHPGTPNLIPRIFYMDQYRSCWCAVVFSPAKCICACSRLLLDTSFYLLCSSSFQVTDLSDNRNGQLCWTDTSPTNCWIQILLNFPALDHMVIVVQIFPLTYDSQSNTRPQDTKKWDK